MYLIPGVGRNIGLPVVVVAAPAPEAKVCDLAVGTLDEYWAIPSVLP